MQRTFIKNVCFTGLLAVMVVAARADNPIVPGIGLTDPHGVVFGDRVYLYATHDASPDSKGFTMTNWWVWSSADLVNWKQEGTLDPKETFLGRPFKNCWATFGVTRNGKYYWYFSAGPQEIGVVMGDSPAGPWRDPLGKPLIAKGFVPTDSRDPDILLDDDGKAYMVFGTFNFHIVRLNDDMISLAEPPRLIPLDQLFGPYGKGRTDDKPSLHKRNGIYYLSWSSFYATADNPYGPYTYKGTVIESNRVAAAFQTDEKSLRHDRHGNFFQFRNQWYYVVNDKSQPGRSDRFRDACLAYAHYRDNGDIAPIRLDAIGVGQYDATQPRIEAEDYSAADGVAVRECPGGFEVRGLRAGSWLAHPNVKNLPHNATLKLQLASADGGGVIEIREGSPTGKNLGQCDIPATGGWEKWKTVECSLVIPPGKMSLCLTFRGAGTELVRLDWLEFAPGTAK